MAEHKLPVTYSDDKMIIDGLEHQKALIHFYFKVDPDALSLPEIAKLWCRLEFALELEGKLKSQAIKTG